MEKYYEIAALMQRDEHGRPYWLRRYEQEKAAAEPSYARDFEERHGFAPAEVETPTYDADAEYRALFAARFGVEASA